MESLDEFDPQFPAYLADAITTFGDAQFDCGDWRAGEDEKWSLVYAAAVQARTLLEQAIIRYRTEPLTPTD